MCLLHSLRLGCDGGGSLAVLLWPMLLDWCFLRLGLSASPPPYCIAGCLFVSHGTGWTMYVAVACVGFALLRLALVRHCLLWFHVASMCALVPLRGLDADPLRLWWSIPGLCVLWRSVCSPASTSSQALMPNGLSMRIARPLRVRLGVRLYSMRLP